MKRNGASTKPATGLRAVRGGHADQISADELDRVFAEVGQTLRDGLSSKTESILRETLENYTHTPDHFATIKRLLSFTLETVGRYKESLDAVKPFEAEE